MTKASYTSAQWRRIKQRKWRPYSWTLAERRKDAAWRGRPHHQARREDERLNATSREVNKNMTIEELKTLIEDRAPEVIVSLRNHGILLAEEIPCEGPGLHPMSDYAALCGVIGSIANALTRDD